MGGVCTAPTQHDPMAAGVSKSIDTDLMKERKKARDIKLLLLGTGESGKSTVAKQMRIIHLQGFSEQEKQNYVEIITGNIITNIRKPLKELESKGVELSSVLKKGSLEHATTLLAPSILSLQRITPELATSLKALWADDGIKKSIAGQSSIGASGDAAGLYSDSLNYYMQHIDRIAAPGYLPDHQDILYSRMKTNGIIDIAFSIKGHPFRMVDVGGQRNERRKWIHCFDDVTAIIYCVAMDDYDLMLEEDGTVNRMKESLTLFGEVCQFFPDTSIILFLNKKDLFIKKIAIVDMGTCFPDYKGGNDYESAAKFLAQKFTAQNPNAETHLYVHTTCATDTNNIRVVFAAVSDIVLRSNMDDQFR